jgi:hypothetical protein
MMTKRNETEDLAALLEQAAAELRLRPRQRNWIDQFRDSEALPLSRAAEVAGADAETYRGWHGGRAPNCYSPKKSLRPQQPNYPYRTFCPVFGAKINLSL